MIKILSKLFNPRKELNSKEKSFLKISEKRNIRKIFEAISSHSGDGEIRYVGGCVRNILKNEEVKDIDLATNLSPTDVKESFKKKGIEFYETGIKHGTITAAIEGNNFEITSLRKDISTDGRHAEVEFTTNWLEDASRRDFTINSIYSDINGNLFDPFNGRNDLSNGNIKFIGNAEERIKEDYLRILRYVRFFLNYSKNKHDPKIKKIILQNIKGVSRLSKERLIDELKKIVLSEGFLKINEDAFCLEVISLIFPQLQKINLFKKLNKYALNNIASKDFIFLLSLMIIDQTDNVEYFLYKYNFSNEAKKRIKFLDNIFSKPLEKKFFSENNLWKIYYFNNKINMEDLIDFEIYRSSKINNNLLTLKKTFAKNEPPKFPVKASHLIDNYNLKEGKELGEFLKKIEDVWIENSFKISEKEIEKILKN